MSGMSVNNNRKTVAQFFFVAKSALTESFSETGNLIKPVDFLVYGDVELFIDIFKGHQLKTEQRPFSVIFPDKVIVRLLP